MLKDKDVMATIPVKDLAVAARFYEDVLGFEPVGDEPMGVRAYKSGSSSMLVYESPNVGTNRATAATWIVGDELDGIIRTLKGKGVKFEHYDFPGAKWEGDVHVFGNIRNAWFKDPDGNILSIVNG